MVAPVRLGKRVAGRAPGSVEDRIEEMFPQTHFDLEPICRRLAVIERAMAPAKERVRAGL
jgi:uncharacterized protein YprB with RNaseH-like and TPR domain